MKYGCCDICGKWGWIDHHTCPPTWDVRQPDYDQEWNQIYAFDAEEAAEKFVEDEEAADCEYECLNGHVKEIEVRAKGGTIQVFDVSAEAIPTYYARPKE